MNPKPEATTVSVSKACTLAVDAVRAWALIRDFNAMPRWNGSVLESRIEAGPADRVGCRRVLLFDDGGVWTHLLTGLSDVDMKLQYSIVATPQPMRIPVWNYRAEILVLPLAAAPAANQACSIEWRAQFETAHADEMKRRASQVFEAGFAGLRRCLETGAAPGAAAPPGD
ncbi:MAG: SRPBCC family protein [Burkholderiales bacterium]